MIKFSIILFYISTLFAFSCKAQSSDLLGKWTHVYEEDAEGLQVYVKGEEPKLPPARFRQVFVFQNDNICKYGSLAANDQHGLKTGTYKLTDDLLVIKDLKGNKLYKFRVIKSTEDEVRLEKL